MNAGQPSPRTIEMPVNQAVAYMIGTPTLLLAPMFYWQFDTALFGASGLTNLFIIAGAGGTVSFALYGGRRRWLIGAVLGLIGGLGAAGAHVLYTMLFHRQSMMTGESALVCWAGAGPAMGALLYILTRDKKSMQQTRDGNEDVR
jgi:nitrate/nitrite transporter NarK